MAVLRKELNSYPGLQAVVQDLSQSGLHRRRAASRSSCRCAGPDWDKLVEVSTERAREADPHRHGGRPRHRLPGRHARAAHHARPRPRRRPGRLGRGGGHHHQRPGGRAARRQVQPRPAGGSTCACGCWPSSARAPRTWPGSSALAQRRADPAVGADHPGGAARPAGGHPPRPRARHHRLRQRRPRPLAERGAGRGRAQLADQHARRLPRGARRRQRDLPRVDGQPAASPWCWGSSWRSWCWPRSSTRCCTRSPSSPSCRCRWRARSFALSLRGITLNIFSMIGLLLLMGIVKKNSIILVDYANQLRAEGEDAAGGHAQGGPGAAAAHPDDLDRHHDGGACPPRWAWGPAPRCARPWPSRSSAAWWSRPRSACWWCPPSTWSPTGRSPACAACATRSTNSATTTPPPVRRADARRAPRTTTPGRPATLALGRRAEARRTDYRDERPVPRRRARGAVSRRAGPIFGSWPTRRWRRREARAAAPSSRRRLAWRAAAGRLWAPGYTAVDRGGGTPRAPPAAAAGDGGAGGGTDSTAAVSAADGSSAAAAPVSDRRRRRRGDAAATAGWQLMAADRAAAARPGPAAAARPVTGVAGVAPASPAARWKHHAAPRDAAVDLPPDSAPAGPASRSSPAPPPRRRGTTAGGPGR